jgi:hypothetical protein
MRAALRLACESGAAARPTPVERDERAPAPPVYEVATLPPGPCRTCARHWRGSTRRCWLHAAPATSCRSWSMPTVMAQVCTRHRLRAPVRGTQRTLKAALSLTGNPAGRVSGLPV